MIEQQLQKYLSEPLEDRHSTDPIKWWFDVGQKSFPLLFNIALDYLAIPATSVPSESVFSIAGLVLNKRRKLLGNEATNMIVTLHNNRRNN